MGDTVLGVALILHHAERAISKEKPSLEATKVDYQLVCGLDLPPTRAQACKIVDSLQKELPDDAREKAGWEALKSIIGGV
jgi:hypothetical protein